MKKGFKFLFFLLVMIITILYFKDGLSEKFKKEYIIDNMFNDNNNAILKSLYSISNKNSSNIDDILDLKILKTPVKSKNKKEETKEKDIMPLAYIYNTHQKEEYALSKSSPYSIRPTVYTGSFILKEELEALNIKTIVEERDVNEILNNKGLDYPYTYDITKDFVIEMQKKYKTLKYFIDLHRDGADKNITTININDKPYAKIMFTIGKNRNNLEQNLKQIEKIKSYLDEHYKGLLRNNYYRDEYSYNEELSDNLFLVELGAQDNTLQEIYNSLKALAEAINYLERGI